MIRVLIKDFNCLEGEKEESFPKFSYDYLIMTYGLKTIALKNLNSISLVRNS